MTNYINMSTDYEFFFNNIKKELNDINYHLYEVIKVYDSLINSIDNFKTSTQDGEDNQDDEDGKQFLKIKFTEFMEHYNSKMDETKNMKNHIDNMIKENCEHTYIDDTIDSGLDNSTSIEYCTKCFKVKE